MIDSLRNLSLQARNEFIKSGLQKMLQPVGVEIDGDHPWDVRINDSHIFQRIITDGILGVCEGYIEGEWSTDDLVELTTRVSGSDAINSLDKIKVASSIIKLFMPKRNRHDPLEVAKAHYNLPHELYEAMLDERMVYSCAYWDQADNLEDAQEAKLDLVCRKVGLKEGHLGLDVGGGWSSLRRYAYERYGAEFNSVTNSAEQFKLAEKLCEGMPGKNSLLDYHDIKDGPIYDCATSIGVFEHVLSEHYREFMEVVYENLKPGGIFLLHTIGRDVSSPPQDTFTTKYVFPNSEIPTAESIAKAYKNLFVMEDWHNLSTNYARTLIEWRKNFRTNWPRLKPLFSQNGQDPDKFFRTWDLYLAGSAGNFISRQLQVWQIVLSKGGVPGGYKRVS